MDKYAKKYEPDCERCTPDVKLKLTATKAELRNSYHEDLSPDEVLIEYYECPKCNLEYTLDEDDFLEDA